MSDLMILLGSGGFFRDNGLNSLPSIKYVGSLLNDPNTFKELDVKIETVVSFVRKSKYTEQKSFTQVYLDTNRPENQVHAPIVVVELWSNLEIQQHAVVLKDPKLSG